MWDLRRIQLRQQTRLANQVIVRAGAVTRTATAIGAEEEKLHIEVSGTAYPVFVVGLHDPDDPDVSRYVP